MIDIHTHILPGMDDGSVSLEESLAMAKESARQGVRLLAATPHFYATQEDPNSFLRRREKSLALLESAWQDSFPTLLVGAEVRYFDGISRVEKIAHLTLDHTRILLLEMPFTSWSRRMVEEVVELQRGASCPCRAVPKGPGRSGVGDIPAKRSVDAVQRQFLPALADKTQSAGIV